MKLIFATGLVLYLLFCLCAGVIHVNGASPNYGIKCIYRNENAKQYWMFFVFESALVAIFIWAAILRH